MNLNKLEIIVDVVVELDSSVSACFSSQIFKQIVQLYREENGITHSSKMVMGHAVTR